MTRRAPDVPTPLLVAAAGAGLEALLLLGTGVLELANLTSGRLAFGLSTSIFFLAYASGLAFCAWMLTRLATWARAPIVLAQLIQLGVAWNFRDSATVLIALALAALAAVVLVGVLHPASTAVLVDDPTGSRSGDEDE